jgi:hypothetical protein
MASTDAAEILKKRYRRPWYSRLYLRLGFCQNCWRRAVRAKLCQVCIDHAIETGAYL